MKTIFQGSFQLTKVRWVMWFSLVCAAGSIWAAVNIGQSYGANPADGGVLAPLATRTALGVGVALLGVSFAVAMWIYGKCYVARIEFDEATGVFCFYTVRFLGTEKQSINALHIWSSRHHEGEYDTGELSGHTPWQTVRIRGRRLPLIIDKQGEVLDEERMQEFLQAK